MGLIADVVREVFEPGDVRPAAVPHGDPEQERADHLATTVRQTMEAGAVPIWPVPWNRVLRCARCGPVYWGAGGQVDGCPWCWVRADGSAVPPALES